MFVVRFRGKKRLLCSLSLLFLKMLLTPCLLVVLLSSLDSNLFRSSIDPLLMYSTSSCCVNVFVASYFVYCLLVGEVRHLGELGGLVPHPYPSVVFVMCLVTFASVLFGAIALIPLCGHSPQIQKKKKKQAIFLSYQQNDGRLLYPASRVYIPVVDSGEGHGGPAPPPYS